MPGSRIGLSRNVKYHFLLVRRLTSGHYLAVGQ